MQAPVQPAHGAALNPNTAHPPTEKQVGFYQKLIASSVFTDAERQEGLEWLANKATRQTIKDQIDWLKNQLETRKQVLVQSPVGGPTGAGEGSPPIPDEPPPWLT